MIAKLTIKTLNTLDRLSKDEEGAGLVEYGMLVGLIAVFCSAAVFGFGTGISNGFTTLSQDVANWFAGSLTGA